jgi:glutathione S-transferase
VADAYAYVISTWTPFMGIDLAKFPAVKAFHDRMAASPMVKEAFARMKDNPATVV